MKHVLSILALGVSLGAAAQTSPSGPASSGPAPVDKPISKAESADAPRTALTGRPNNKIESSAGFVEGLIGKYRTGQTPAYTEIRRLNPSLAAYTDDVREQAAVIFIKSGHGKIETADYARLVEGSLLASPDLTDKQKILFVQDLINSDPAIRPVTKENRRRWVRNAFRFLKDHDDVSTQDPMRQLLPIMESDGYACEYLQTRGQVRNATGATWIADRLPKEPAKLEALVFASQMKSYLLDDIAVRQGFTVAQGKEVLTVARRAGYSAGSDLDADLALMLAHRALNQLDTAGICAGAAWPKMKTLTETQYPNLDLLLPTVVDMLPYGQQHMYWAEITHELNLRPKSPWHDVPTEIVALATAKRFAEADALLTKHRPESPNDEMKLLEASAVLAYLKGDPAKAYAKFRQFEQTSGLALTGISYTLKLAAGERSGKGDKRAPFEARDLDLRVPDWVVGEIEDYFTR